MFILLGLLFLYLTQGLQISLASAKPLSKALKAQKTLRLPKYFEPHFKKK